MKIYYSEKTQRGKKMKNFTREQYLKNECTHREYYAQYVTDKTINNVEKFIGIDKIKKSNDEHFNDIPLRIWDNIPVTIDKDLLTKNKDLFTLSCKVCICKEVARQIKEGKIK